MRRFLVCAVVLAVLVATAFVAGGYVLFSRSQADPLTEADAIVVLGGDTDGRIDYGLRLAREGYAHTVVISDSYPADDVTVRRACASGTPSITVICFVPDPWTTQGEAMFASRLARERGWSRLIVVSWNWHLVRARFIFHQCFDGELTMRPVPRTYDDYGPAQWVSVYAYQYAAFAKAMTLGCRMPPQSQASSALTAEVTASSSSLARARAAAN
ncbi:YdcF family protein [Mycolicibacterium mengxianglii]|uniref:YdcF family protein n=1 Tax=Mycolicibacterium mengxianglii TaxID=2736649 RepID=UPI001E646F87|nr:YdcF family protein [Mycolicibacterium mengxianglii]